MQRLTAADSRRLKASVVFGLKGFGWALSASTAAGAASTDVGLASVAQRPSLWVAT